MFDIEKFYRDAESGEQVDEKGFIEYLQGYNNVIIWGAGNLGTALGKKLLDKGVKIAAYWDAKYNEIKECNHISVLETFTGGFDESETIVIIGIVNGTLSHRWQRAQLEKHGYYNYLFGMKIYEGIGCNMYVGQSLDVIQCTGSSICNFNTCKKYMKILEKDIAAEKKDIISVQVLEFIVSHRCTLDCIHCGQQVGVIKRKAPQHYRDYDLERIKEDIDICMDNIDVVGTFSIIGGEPFIHPDIIEIVEHCLTKKNVGIIAITTNGICRMDENELKRIKNPRLKINFSNYTGALDDKKKKIFSENVEKVKRLGLNCNVATPVWNSVTDELCEKPDMSEEKLRNRKKQCNMGPSVSNGVFYACPMIELYSKTGRFPVENQYVVLDNSSDIREKIKDLLQRPYYECCGYRCSNSKYGYEVVPGEQYKE